MNIRFLFIFLKSKIKKIFINKKKIVYLICFKIKKLKRYFFEYIVIFWIVFYVNFVKFEK